MENSKRFEHIFSTLGIKSAPLPANYDPDTYARRLIDKNYDPGHIVYSTTTNARL